MHKQSHVGAIADRAQPVLAPALRLIVDFAGILDRQHMPALRRRGYEHRPMHHHFLDRDRLVREEATKLDLFAPIVRQLAHAHRLPLSDTARDQLAILLQSASPKYPIVISTVASSFESRRHKQNHARIALCNPNRHRNKRIAAQHSLTRTATSVLNLARKGGGRSLRHARRITARYERVATWQLHLVHHRVAQHADLRHFDLDHVARLSHFGGL